MHLMNLLGGVRRLHLLHLLTPARPPKQRRVSAGRLLVARQPHQWPVPLVLLLERLGRQRGYPPLRSNLLGSRAFASPQASTWEATRRRRSRNSLSGSSNFNSFSSLLPTFNPISSTRPRSADTFKSSSGQRSNRLRSTRSSRSRGSSKSGTRPNSIRRG